MVTIEPFRHHKNVVIGNGSYPTAPQPLSVIENASYIACCDGAANHFTTLGTRQPDLIIGDGDSISPEVRRLYANRFILVSEQENNDQTKAVKHLISAGRYNISIVGATGGREDHTLGNISLLIEYLRLGANVNMFTDTGVFVPVNKGAYLTAVPGQPISIFNFTCRRLTMRGVEYPTRAFTNWWQGSLNRVTRPKVEIAADGIYLLYLAYPQ